MISPGMSRCRGMKHSFGGCSLVVAFENPSTWSGCMVVDSPPFLFAFTFLVDLLTGS
jgi:hypothetical protein